MQKKKGSDPFSPSFLTPLRWLDRRDRLRWFLLVPVVTVAALVEAAGALAVFGLLRLIVEPGALRTTPVVSDIAARFGPGQDATVITLLIAAVAGLYVVRALFLAWAEWLKQEAVQGSAARAAARLFGRYLSADYVFHLRRRSAALIEEVTRSADVAFQLVAASALHIFAELATIVALVGVVLVTAPPAALAGVAAVLAVAALPMYFARRGWTRWGEAQRALEEQQLRVLQQSLGAIKDLIVTGRQAVFEDRFRETRRELARIRRRSVAASSWLRIGVETLLILSMLFVLALLTTEQSGSQTVSLMALFAYTGFRVVPSVNRLMLNAGYLREGMAYVRSFDADLRAAAAHAGVMRKHVSRLPFAGTIRCERVTLEYEPGGRRALDEVSLEIRAGESVGIVGPTGAGKSSLVDVIIGLLPPGSGRVTVDGVDIAGQERDWLSQVGYVPQSPFILDDTIRRNVAFGVPDALIDDERVARAIEMAQLDDVVSQRQDGLDADLGEGGVRLSGGQRQRVAIARALYHDPAVLVFDEATAALDPQTEREVTGAIAALHGTRTLIVIAHRLATVEACDRLIYLRDGRIAGVGRYDELLDDPAFRAMARP